MRKKRSRLYKPMKDIFLSSLDKALANREDTTNKTKEMLFSVFWELEGADLEARTLLNQHESGEIQLDDKTLRDCVLTIYGDDNLKAIEKMNQLGLKNDAKTK